MGGGGARPHRGTAQVRINVDLVLSGDGVCDLLANHTEQVRDLLASAVVTKVPPLSYRGGRGLLLPLHFLLRSCFFSPSCAYCAYVFFSSSMPPILTRRAAAPGSQVNGSAVGVLDDSDLVAFRIDGCPVRPSLNPAPSFDPTSHAPPGCGGGGLASFLPPPSLSTSA